MNRIVRENYPVADLPEAFKEGLESDDYVRVTLESERRTDADSLSARQELLEQLFAQAEPSFSSHEQIAEHVEALRKEWD